MTNEAELRRRPISSGRRRASAPRANVVEERGNSKDVISAVLSQLGVQLEAFINELRLREMKPWGDFFAHFKAPRAWNTSILDERLTTNFLHYRGNYSVIAAGLFLMGIISHPSVLVALLSCALLVTFLFPAGEHPRIVRLGERILESSERIAAGVFGVACILGLTGAWYTLLFYGGLALFVCTVHALFRPTTISSKARRAAADAHVAASGFTIESAQNFVEGILGMNRFNTRSQ